MAETPSPNSTSPERRPVQVSSSSSSNQLATSGSSELQPVSLGQISLPSNLSSTMVPVRLDVLYFLLTSAFRGAPHAFPLTPVQGSLSTCCGPAPQPAASCCSCHSACHGMVGYAAIQQPSGIQQQGRPHGDYGGHGWPSSGVAESQNNGHRWGGTFQRSDGDSWSGACQPSSVVRRRRAQSPVGWQENQRKEGRGNRDNWQSRRQTFQTPWGDHRQGAADSVPWKSGSRDSGREVSSFGSNSGNGKRGQEGCYWQAPRSGPDAKRRSEGARMRWWTDQQTKPSQTCVGNTAGVGLAKTGVQGSEEDWEADYESGPAIPTAPGTLPLSSHQNDQAGTSRAGKDLDDGCTPPAVLPKRRLATSPLPELATKDQGAAAGGKDQSNSDGFTSYLRNLYSDPPGKSSSEASSDLVIDTDMDSLKPEEEESS